MVVSLEAAMIWPSEGNYRHRQKDHEDRYSLINTDGGGKLNKQREN
jgi:hypothetical protein